MTEAKRLPLFALRLMLPWHEGRVMALESIVVECVQSGQEVVEETPNGRRYRWDAASAEEALIAAYASIEKVKAQIDEYQQG
jgi:hypothetical protein